MVSVVAVGCHPDDVESGCFGTLALYKKRKIDITILLLTGGEKGRKEINVENIRIAF